MQQRLRKISIAGSRLTNDSINCELQLKSYRTNKVEEDFITRSGGHKDQIEDSGED